MKFSLHGANMPCRLHGIASMTCRLQSIIPMPSRLHGIRYRPFRLHGIRHRPFHLHGIIALALALPLVTGCGVRIAGHRLLPIGSGEKAGEARAREVREAREQARLAPAEPYWPYRQAQLALESDSTAVAEAALRAALDRDPCHAPSLALLSKLQFDAGRHAEAVQMLEGARSRGCPKGFPDELAAGLALHYDALDRPADARDAMAGVKHRDSKRVGPATLYLTLRGEGDEPVDDLAKSARDGDPNSAVHQNNFGIARMRAGDAKAARAAFLAAIERDPSLPGPYYNLAILDKYFTLDDAAAARWFDLYWERSRRDPDGLAAVFGKDEPKPTAATGE